MFQIGFVLMQSTRTPSRRGGLQRINPFGRGIRGVGGQRPSYLTTDIVQKLRDLQNTRPNSELRKLILLDLLDLFQRSPCSTYQLLDINNTNTTNKTTALHVLIKEGESLDTIKTFIGICPKHRIPKLLRTQDIPNKDTPLHVACRYSTPDIIEYLIKKTTPFTTKCFRNTNTHGYLVCHYALLNTNGESIPLSTLKVLLVQSCKKEYEWDRCWSLALLTGQSSEELLQFMLERTPSHRVGYFNPFFGLQHFSDDNTVAQIQYQAQPLTVDQAAIFATLCATKLQRLTFHYKPGWDSKAFVQFLNVLQLQQQQQATVSASLNNNNTTLTRIEGITLPNLSTATSPTGRQQVLDALETFLVSQTELIEITMHLPDCSDVTIWKDWMHAIQKGLDQLVSLSSSGTTSNSKLESVKLETNYFVVRRRRRQQIRGSVNNNNNNIDDDVVAVQQHIILNAKVSSVAVLNRHRRRRQKQVSKRSSSLPSTTTLSSLLPYHLDVCFDNFDFEDEDFIERLQHLVPITNLRSLTLRSSSNAINQGGGDAAGQQQDQQQPLLIPKDTSSIAKFLLSYDSRDAPHQHSLEELHIRGYYFDPIPIFDALKRISLPTSVGCLGVRGVGAGLKTFRATFNYLPEQQPQQQQQQQQQEEIPNLSNDTRILEACLEMVEHHNLTLHNCHPWCEEDHRIRYYTDLNRFGRAHLRSLDAEKKTPTTTMTSPCRLQTEEEADTTYTDVADTDHDVIVTANTVIESVGQKNEEVSLSCITNSRIQTDFAASTTTHNSSNNNINHHGNITLTTTNAIMGSSSLVDLLLAVSDDQHFRTTKSAVNASLNDIFIHQDVENRRASIRYGLLRELPTLWCHSNNNNDNYNEQKKDEYEKSTTLTGSTSVFDKNNRRSGLLRPKRRQVVEATLEDWEEELIETTSSSSSSSSSNIVVAVSNCGCLPRSSTSSSRRKSSGRFRGLLVGSN